MPSAVASIRRVIDGELEDLPLPELIQFFHLQGRDGLLAVINEAGERAAGLYYRRRQIIHAVCRGLEGPEAVYAALSFQSGRFEFIAGPTESLRATVSDSVQNLILEGMRRLDGHPHQSSLLPPDDTVLYLAPEPPQDDIRLTAKEWSILSLVNGKRTILQIVETSGRTEEDVRAILTSLLAADLVVDSKNDVYLDEIVPRTAGDRRGGEIRFAAPTLRGTLILKRIDGVKTLREILREMDLDEGAFADDFRLLVRSGVVSFARGEEPYRKWLLPT